MERVGGLMIRVVLNSGQYGSSGNRVLEGSPADHCDCCHKLLLGTCIWNFTENNLGSQIVHTGHRKGKGVEKERGD